MFQNPQTCVEFTQANDFSKFFYNCGNKFIKSHSIHPLQI
jgi:hypothetical protein